VKTLWLVGALVAGISLVSALTLIWFVRPRQHVPVGADAVVVNAGGRGERLRRAIELMEAGIAPTLILNRGQEEWIGRAAIDRVCDRAHDGYEVRCIVAPIDSTAGEGQAFAALAHERGLSHLVLVTSDYHLFRASLWLRRYFRGKVERVGAGGRASARMYVHEWGGVVRACLPS